MNSHRSAIQKRRTTRGTRPPSGFSLLEVILAISIVFASVIALTQTIGIARRHANKTDQMTRAQIICQNKMDELVVGILPLEPVEEMPLANDRNWSYSVDVGSTSWDELVSVRVRVSRTIIRGQADRMTDKRPDVELVRWIRMPLQPLATGAVGESGLD